MTTYLYVTTQLKIMIDKLLNQLGACKEATEWAKGKSWHEIYTTCHRGDWLCWLFRRTNPADLQLLTLVKGHQANTVRHLIQDERSLRAIDIAIAFGEGKASKEMLDDAAYAARAAVYAAAAAAADYAVYAAAAATDAAYAAAYAATDAAYAADAAAYAAASAAHQTNMKLTADIARKYLPIDIWNINED